MLAFGGVEPAGVVAEACADPEEPGRRVLASEAGSPPFPTGTTRACLVERARLRLGFGVTVIEPNLSSSVENLERDGAETRGDIACAGGERHRAARGPGRHLKSLQPIEGVPRLRLGGECHGGTLSKWWTQSSSGTWYSCASTSHVALSPFSAGVIVSVPGPAVISWISASSSLGLAGCDGAEAA